MIVSKVIAVIKAIKVVDGESMGKVGVEPPIVAAVSQKP